MPSSTLPRPDRPWSARDLGGERLPGFLERNQGCSSEKISAAVETDANTLRPVMRRLIDDGKVKTKGERRGTRYFVGV